MSHFTKYLKQRELITIITPNLLHMMSDSNPRVVFAAYSALIETMIRVRLPFENFSGINFYAN